MGTILGVPLVFLVGTLLGVPLGVLVGSLLGVPLDVLVGVLLKFLRGLMQAQRLFQEGGLVLHMCYHRHFHYHCPSRL